jgi:non-canonical (house-cleaning) NTP pyrophosphatase
MATMEEVHVAVGSANPAKIAAVEKAFEAVHLGGPRITVVGLEVASGVSDQVSHMY